ncbi:decarboxylase [Phormidium sp. FACHB-592]|uniref:Decarboxylase n=1 Tax=Stenomitos frigidus AS-A4 TaxID=2933935 RepID=A0ABV0KIJ4_9CYAN|nr:decarboxylase [Phormidium sp. FACHB-592]MBD2075702.1 decarboxylase [Phormidium sp. FACHB-592]
MVATPTPRPPFSLALAETLLDTYGSPLYVYKGDRLRQTIQHITQAISYPQTRFHFASVTNGNIALLQIFREASWGLHANTPGDIYLGLHAGFHPSQILYSGSNLNRPEMEQLFRWGITTLNLDSLAQLQLCCETWQALALERAQEHESAKTAHDSTTLLSLHPSSPSPSPPPLLSSPSPLLGLRLNFPALTGDSRIGVHPDDFPAAVALAHQVGLQIKGLHFYRGTGTNATAAFTEAIDTVLTLASLLPDWSYLDFGGGFGYPYHHGGAAFDWYEFGTALSHRLNQLDRPLDLIIEPGRAAIAGCASLLTRVVSVKWQGEKQILGVDTTVANLSVPSVHGGYRAIVTWQNDPEGKPKQPLYLTDICGNTTYSRDYLGKNCQLPALAIGDVLAVLDVGAYGYAMSSHFLHRPRPAEVLIEGNNHRLIRQREEYSALLSNQVFVSGVL